MLLQPNDIDGLRQALFGLPGDMKVEADADTGISAKTVDELRAMTSWPPGLRVDTPRERYPESTVRISKPAD
jgi:hypothetical protein